ncbi:MAG: ribosome maturation factor RimP [Actinobacteria bacterium]|jgi:ribosome maturation factor RimP|nr:ribosome maturation factor RimP [Actinomycetota bacterium]
MGALEEVRDLAEAVARRHSLRLWDVEMTGRGGSSVLRVFVDADDGVDLDTVATVADELSRALDLKDPIDTRYTLEVSSPGLERALKEPEHYRLSKGKEVTIKTKEPVVANSNRVDGVIKDLDDSAVQIETKEGVVAVPFGSVKTARTVFEWKGKDKR